MVLAWIMFLIGLLFSDSRKSRPAVETWGQLADINPRLEMEGRMIVYRKVIYDSPSSTNIGRRQLFRG